MFEELDKPLKYVIFAILYIEIFSFMFNPKIKVQMMICVLVLTAIASISLVYDMHNGIDKPLSKISGLSTGIGITGSFVKLLPQFIKEQNVSAPIGWFIGFIAFMNLIAILLVTKIEYKSDASHKLSSKSEKRLNSVKGVFISIVVSAAMMSIISYFMFNKEKTISSVFGNITLSKLEWLNSVRLSEIIGNTSALGFLTAYTFGASVYTLDTSRKLHKLIVNNLIAN